MPLGSKSRFHRDGSKFYKLCGSLMGSSFILVQFRWDKVPERKMLHTVMLATLDLTPPVQELAGNEVGWFKTGIHTIAGLAVSAVFRTQNCTYIHCSSNSIQATDPCSFEN